MTIYIEIMLGMATGAVVGFSFAYKGVLMNRQQNRIRDIDFFFMQVREALDSIVEDTAANNAILLSVHNNGGELLAGTPLFSSVLEEKPEEPQYSIKKDWQEIPVDHEYFGVITKLTKNKEIQVLTETMEKGGLMAIVYDSMNVAGSFLFEIYKTDRSYYYISVPFKDGYEKLSSSKEFLKLQFAVNKLKQLCKENDRKGILK